MKILLTGPTGFIGKAFIPLALSRGHQVAGLVIPSERIPAELPPGKDLVWLRGTLEAAPWDEIASFRADVCMHMAWITTPGIYLETPENFRFLQSSIHFLRKVRESRCRHIFGLGTCIEYKIANEPLSEELTPAEPATTYARCKSELRLAMEAEARAHDFVFCWGRVFYPYGPREHPSRLCSSLIQKFTRNEKVILRTPQSTKDYIYIDDLAAALLIVLEKKFHGIINLGTGIGLSVRKIAQTVALMMDKSELIEEANPPQVDPLGYVVANASKLIGLGWQPEHDLKRGLEKLMAALRQTGVLKEQEP